MSENGLLGKTEYRMGKQRTITDKPLKKPKPNEPLELLGKLHKAEDTETRRVLVAEANPFFYIFGEEIKPWKLWLNYEDNMNTLYIGAPR